MNMRFFLIGPRILGIRPGISFGLNELLRLATKPTHRKPAESMTGSFLYVIRGDHNMTKVGVTTNPTARLASLRTGSAFPIDFSYIAVTPGTGFDIEQGAHAMLASHRCNGEWFDVQSEIAVAAIAGAAHKLGQPLLPITAEVANRILQIAANGGGPSSNNKYLFDGLPWWLRWPLQMIGGAICGVVAFVAFTLLYFIAASPR
jgi:Meiotically up-regulated gene 113